MIFSKKTGDITVSVEPFYLIDQSDTDNHHYVWAYTVIIENHAPYDVKLTRRCWHITDSGGQTQTVEGEGVVGETPTLPASGGIFKYTSGTVLRTCSGIMVGTYTMINEETRELITIDIPAFSLDSPAQAQRPN